MGSVKRQALSVVATAFLTGSVGLIVTVTTPVWASAGNATLTIEFQKSTTNDTYASWMGDNVKLFEKSHPNVTFNVTDNASSNTYLTKITAQMAAGDTPDIFEGWTSNRMKPFVDAGRVLDISSLLSSDNTLQNTVLKTALSGTTFHKRVYGLPTTLDAEVIYYNKNVFRKYGLKIPTTYNDFLRLIKTLKSHGVTPITVPNQESWNGAIPFQMLEERIGGLKSYQELAVDNTIPWTSAPVIKAATMLQQLIKVGAFNQNVNSTTTNQSTADLTTGKAAMYMNGTWMIPSLSQSMGNNVGFFNFPNIKGGKGSSGDLIELANNALYISAHTQNKAVATQFLDFCFSRQRQVALAKAGYLTATSTKLPANAISPLASAIHDAEIKATGSMYPFDLPLGVNMGEQFDNATQLLYTGAQPKQVFQNFENLLQSQGNS